MKETSKSHMNSIAFPTGISSSILFEALTACFGDYSIKASQYGLELWWDLSEEAPSVMYFKDGGSKDLSRGLRKVYGELFGGFLVGNSLKVALTLDLEIFGLYRIPELQSHPNIALVMEREPALEFFMDSSNIWYYALGGENLHIFDVETQELDNLGPVKEALIKVFREFKEAAT